MNELLETQHLKERIIRLNEFLTAVYKSETRLSDLLEKCGFDTEQINIIRNQHLERFVNSFLDLLKARMVNFSNDRRLQDILFRRFGLEGKPPETLQDIAVTYYLSRERIRQLEKKALRRCRHPSHRRFWESNLRELAQALLSKKENAAS